MWDDDDDENEDDPKKPRPVRILKKTTNATEAAKGGSGRLVRSDEDLDRHRHVA